MAIQNIELNKCDNVNIHCPFCGKRVLEQDGDMSKALEETFSPCQHTLFFAHDFDLYYRSDAFDQKMETKGQTVYDIEENDDFDGWDSFTANIPIENGIRVAMYQGAPSFYGSYLGFSVSNY